MTNLELWLSSLYRADVLGRGDWDKTLATARTAVAADADLTTAVAAKMRELSPVVKQRGDNSAIIEKKMHKYCQLLLEKENVDA